MLYVVECDTDSCCSEKDSDWTMKRGLGILIQRKCDRKRLNGGMFPFEERLFPVATTGRIFH